LTLEELISRAAADRLDAAEVAETAASLGVSARELFDQFARLLAERYREGSYSWEFGDAAMNQLFTFAYVTTELGLSPFARAVFGAFDEGEYVREEEPQGEALTRLMIDSLIRSGGA
jgi:hypothetical protein